MAGDEIQYSNSLDADRKRLEMTGRLPKEFDLGRLRLSGKTPNISQNQEIRRSFA